MKFRVSSNDLFRRTAIVVEINERASKAKKILGRRLPADYWDFIPTDAQQEESCIKSNRRVLSPTQVALPTFTYLLQFCIVFIWILQMFTVFKFNLC